MGVTGEVFVNKSPNGIFTTNDLVTGKAVIKVTDSVDVTEVQIRFEGVATSVVRYFQSAPVSTVVVMNNRRRGLARPMVMPVNNRRQQVVVVNKHRVVSHTVTVFPSKEERQVLQNSEYTLPQGTYEYPFSFNIPEKSECQYGAGKYANRDSPEFYTKFQDHGTYRMGGMFTSSRWATRVGTNSSHTDTLLPPSFSIGDHASVDYRVRVIVKRPSTFSRDMRAYQSILFRPYDMLAPTLNLANYDLVQSFYAPSRMGKAECLIRLRMDTPYVVSGQPLPITLLVGGKRTNQKVQLPTIYISQVSIKLVSVVDVRAIREGLMSPTMHMISVPRTSRLFDKFLDLYPADLSNADSSGFVKIPRKLYSCTLPLSTAPTFETCNISWRHSLEVTVRYAFTSSASLGLWGRFKGDHISKLTFLTNEILVKSGLGPIEPPRVQADPDEPLPLYSERAPS